jgi:nucleotide-binding universal stress UspA family protein
MLNTILVPLDGSPLAETALDPAMLLAKRFDATLLLVRTLFPEEPPEGDKRSPRFAATHDAQRYLKSIADYLSSEGIVAQTVILPMEAAEGIIDEAEFSRVDLIVMTTHGRKGISALLHPSVTWRVLRQTNAPILACKCASEDDPAAPSLHLPRFMTDPKAPILVPLDGSLQAEAVLPIAQELARVFGNRLLLVRAGEQPYIAGGIIGYEAVLAEAVKWSLDEAESYLKRKAMELASTGLEVEIATAVGGAATFIQEVAEERQVGLIIIASHGRGWLGRLVLGSVAQRILQEVDMPVLLVRRHPTPAEAEQPPVSATVKEKRAAIR